MTYKPPYGLTLISSLRPRTYSLDGWRIQQRLEMPHPRWFVHGHGKTYLAHSLREAVERIKLTVNHGT